jgi:hypothetical protein
MGCGALPDLGGGVGHGRAGNAVVNGFVAHDSDDVEGGELDGAPAAHNNLGRLHIAVDDAGLIEGAQSVGHRQSYADGLVGRQAAALPEDGSEVAALDVLHHHVGHRLYAAAQDAHHVGRLAGGGGGEQLYFGPHACAVAVGQDASEDLDGRDLARRGVARSPDVAEAPAAQPCLEEVVGDLATSLETA